jgi:hypothetical protein
MDEQSTLSQFSDESLRDTNVSECEVCGETFDSRKGKGIHRSQSHTDAERKTVLRDELKRLAVELGESPGLRQMEEHGKFSASVYQDLFGSWNGALDSVGLPFNEQRNIPKNKLITELNQLAGELGRTPTSRDMQEQGGHVPATYSRIFGSWNEAVEAAGLEPTRQREVSDTALITELQRVADDLDHPPTADDMHDQGRFGVTTYLKAFGTWNDGLRAADLSVNKRRDIPPADLKDELTRLHDELGRVPTSVDMQQEGDYTPSTYARQFGTWNEALEAVDFAPKLHRDIPTGELLRELDRLSAELGRSPTAESMAEYGRFAVKTYNRVFGSWNDALKQANLPLNNRNDISRAELIDELQQLADRLNETPGLRQMDTLGEFDSTTYMSTFGSWNNAVVAADLEPIERRDIPREDLLEEIERLAESLGRAPIREEMSQCGKFGSSTYAERFGSWSEALTAAGFDPYKTFYPDHLDHFVRSTWEETVAGILLDAGVSYGYESLEIPYADGRIYVPDFVTSDYVIEVKGRIYANEKQKAKTAVEKLDNRQYVVIGTKLPADIHLAWEERDNLRSLVNSDEN